MGTTICTGYAWRLPIGQGNCGCYRDDKKKAAEEMPRRREEAKLEPISP